MGNRCKTKWQFIEDAQKVHGNKYDYSNVEYVNCKKKVKITCPLHGDFMITPDGHLQGRGCPVCRYIRPKVANPESVNDLHLLKTTEQAYIVWHSMLNRCYSKKYQSKRNTYYNVSVCEEWHKFSNFKKWFDEHYVDGWQLDKDILVKGNREYAPNKCCFVPQELNTIILKSQKTRGKYPIGVSFNKRLNKFRADYSTKEGKVYLGLFNDETEAFNAYKTKKEQHIKNIADKWKSKIDVEVYNALYNYNVEITD